jgi:formyltetrahydrofolate-dependent phosphoribosylglycinamide formyltransferase
VLISGGGRTLKNLLNAIDRGDLDARVSVVISSMPDVRGLEVAAVAGIPAAVVQRQAYASLTEFSGGIYDAVSPFAPDLLIMAGFLRKMLVFPGWEGRILNIHPALLPEASAYAAGKGKFGNRVHAAVLENGDRVTGATVHLVTDEYDAGPPLARVEVPVRPGDTPETLAARVFAAETEIYPAAIRRYITDHPALKRPLSPRGSRESTCHSRSHTFSSETRRR